MSTGRVYDIMDDQDLEDLQRMRASMIGHSHRVIGHCFDLLKGKFRVGKHPLRRLCGLWAPYDRYSKRKSDLRHRVALGIVALYNDLCEEKVGEWQCRNDGTRLRVILDEVPDRAYVRPVPWDRVFEEMFEAQWSLAALSRLTGERAHTLSRMAWALGNPSMMMGESVLWAARLIREERVEPPPLGGVIYTRPQRRTREDHDTPCELPKPIRNHAR